MQPRRSLALVVGALLLCLPALSACGFHQATDRVYTQANGINYREGDVYVLNAVIAAGQPDSGTLIASFSNRSETQAATLDSVAGAQGNAVQGGDFAPVKIPAMGFVNLADTGGVTVSGTFAAGDVLPMSLNFADGKTITMDVPVVYACQQYAGLDVSQSSGSPSATSSTESSTGSSTAASTESSTAASATPSATPLASDQGSPSTSASPETSASGSGQPTPSPSDTGAASGSASADASSYVCGSTGGTGGRN